MNERNEMYQEIAPYLHPGEDVLWMGKATSAYDPNRSPFTVIFMLFFLGFAIFWTVMATSMAGVMGIFGLLFIGVALYTFYRMFFGRKRAVLRSVYVVTDTRAIILADVPRKGRTCTEYAFANLSTISVENVKDNVGTIRFAPLLTRYDMRHGHRYGSAYDMENDVCTAFYMIEDVHSVYHMISERLH